MKTNKFNLILSKVIGVTSVSETDILGKSRKRDIVEARHVVRFLCIKSGMGYVDTARLTNCHHATVISSVRRVENLIFSDKAFKKQIEVNYSNFLSNNLGKPVYIVGKVSGEPYEQCKRKFNQREKELNNLGFMAVNPMKIVPKNTPWHEAMRISIGNLVQCFAVSPLDDWKYSQGAKIEMNIAKTIQLEIIPNDDERLH
jgi:hypothetical protein